MNLSPESPELTAYLLGELSSSECARVEAALREFPELRAEVESLRLTSEQLTRELAAEPVVELSSVQRGALLIPTKSGAAKNSTGSSSTRTPPAWWEAVLAWRQRLIWAAAGMSALVLALLLLPRPTVSKSEELRYQEVPQRESLSLAPVTDSLVLQPGASLGQEPSQLAALQPAETSSERRKLSRNLAAGLFDDSRQVEAKSTRGKVDLGTPLRSKAGAEAEQLTRGMDPMLARRYGLIPQVTLAPTAPDALPALPPLERNTFREATPRARLVEPGVGGLQLMEESRGRLVSSGTESYGSITDNPFKEVLSARLSTFGLDVDTASYANVRRFLRDGSLPPPEAVRLEELVNYFHYDYPTPNRDVPFASTLEIADSPWKEGHKLVRIGLQARTVDRRERPPANLVFLLDVSGSMEPENKLPLVKRSLRLLLERLTEQDSVGIVTYAGESRIALEPTRVSREGRTRINDVIEGLRAGSGTAGAAGIVDAYRLATNRLQRDWVNRVILCTDGDFNIGLSDPAELQALIEEKAKSGVFLSVLGYGLGNLKDSTMELLADKGNGNYAYVDSFTEARKVLSEQLEGTLITVAKDVKVQVEFNPSRVKSYRLLGYENRALRDRDFNDDTKDAGDVGAGHQVTVLYEIEPTTLNLAGVDPLRYQVKAEPTASERRAETPHTDELFHLRLRYKLPTGDQSRLIETPVKDTDREFAQASVDFKFAAAVAGYGMLLRNSPYRGDLTWEQVLRLAEQGLGADREGYRAEFVDFVRRAQQLSGQTSGEQPSSNRPRPRPPIFQGE